MIRTLQRCSVSESPAGVCGSSRDRERVVGRTEPRQLPLHPSREESHLQPLLKAETEAALSSAVRSRVRRIQPEPTAKQVVTLRLIINRLVAPEVVHCENETLQKKGP
ncbi:hypothetical protein Q5P01_024423 [Channa striata]|uniref:Uncharacterized protein n=1 Tax=Channa striata TaxID=64152 RepID=A0AA88LMZ8_CHASR|nr:hypothetical protein Q5P01_024423 [Channa striata]